MTQDQQRFIDGMGDHIEHQGVPRIAGRLLALLMLSPEPVSLDELAETLEVSKGSISSNARFLVRGGIAERIKRPGDRRDYYQIAEDAQARVMKTYLQRMEDLLTRLEQGREAVPRGEVAVRARFDEMIDETRDMLAGLRARIAG